MRRSNLPDISVIIPVLNEEENLRKLIPYLCSRSTGPSEIEIIVADGGSTDGSVDIASALGVSVIRSPRGRARQMNAGASAAKGRVLYFLHADSFPPEKFDEMILNALDGRIEAGCFRLNFESKSIFLGFFAWFSRINLPLCRGGDQSLFITRSLFKTLGGFNERYAIYEDNEFIGRIYQKAKFRVLPYYLRTSARKYAQNGRFKLQYHFARIHLLHFMGRDPEILYDYYRKNIK
jgi:rSAM/selenodomain-associated transferase 2